MTESTITILTSSIAAITSLIVVFITIRTQSKIEKQKVELENSINSYNDKLERNRSHSQFQRDRIIKYLDELMESYNNLKTLVQVVGLREWVSRNEDYEYEKKFRLFINKINTNINLLKSIGSIDKEQMEEFSEKKYKSRWSNVMSQAIVRTKEYRKDYPDSEEFNSSKFHKEWLILESEISELGRIIYSIEGNIKVPK